MFFINCFSVLLLLFFFFYGIECKKGRSAMDLERPLHYRREGKIDQMKGLRLRCLCTRHSGFEDLKIIGVVKDGARERVPAP